MNKRLQMLRLTAEGYVEALMSHALPYPAAEDLVRFLEQSKTEGQSAALRVFRQRLRFQLTVGA